MTPAARTQAAIEMLDQIIASARDNGAAADVLIQRWFAVRRYAGSKDRRAIRGLIYDAVRLLGERPESGRAAMLSLAAGRPEMLSAFDGSPYGPAAIDPAEAVAVPGHAPAWLVATLAESDMGPAEQAALLGRAPLDLRVNRIKADAAQLIAEIPDAERIDSVPDALRLPADTRIDHLPAYNKGEIEVQDAGSQLVTMAAQAERGHRVVDLCAGAGGKTLALAAAMGNVGHVLACDIVRDRLQRLPERAARAGVSIAETRLLNPGKESQMLADQSGRADVVFVDAPCSGTGTWRRNPEARWRLTPERLARLVETQRNILDIAAELVRPGGALIHVVCSVLDAEGAGQAQAFLERHPGWVAEPLSLGSGTVRGPGLRFTPLQHSTDGFFVARILRP